MRRQAPPLEAIEAFIMASRAENFRAAADRLAISPSAFSRRIQALEAFVGAPLFMRDAGVPRLTPAGERYLREVEPAIEAIRQATVELSERHASGPLTVVMPQSFAMAYLAPRLAAFDSEIEIRIGHDVGELREGSADVAILANPDPRGLPSESLVDLHALLVSAPRLADGRAPPRSLEELPQFRRCDVFQPTGIWETWLASVGYAGPRLQEATHYQSMFVMHEAVAAGMGIALGVEHLVDRYLRDGRLVACLPCRGSTGVHYEIVFADAAVRRLPRTQAFTSWLRSEMGAPAAH
jgi:LysR family glycine cleavage system transcriptional activator